MRNQRALEFETLVELYYRPVFNLAVSLCGKLEQALALTHHTFCLALDRQSYLGEADRARSWLLTILLREFLKGQRQEALAVSRWAAQNSIDPPVVRGNQAEPANAIPVEGALSRLREELRIPFILFYLKDFSCSQIADLLGLSMEAVLRRLSQGRQQFKLALAAAKRAGRQTRLPPTGGARGVEFLPVAA